MKSGRKHELEPHDLAQWIADFPKWCRENRTNLIYVAVVLLLVLVSVYLKWFRQDTRSIEDMVKVTTLAEQLGQTRQQIAQGQATSDNALMIANEFEATARQSEQEAVDVLSLIKAAEAIRTELHYKKTSYAPEAMMAQVEKAQKFYEQAIQKAEGNKTLIALAKYGIALCEEERGNFQVAKEAYQQIANDPQFAGTAITYRAKLRFETTDDNIKPVYISISQPAPQQNAPQLLPEIKVAD